jgi:hypothetical protein
MSEDPAQRRRFPRYPSDLEATVFLDSGHVQARIVMISRGGGLVSPPLAPYQSPQIRLSFQLGDGQPPINCKGEIVYMISDRGTGVAFTEISLYNQDRITAFFEKQPASQPSTV